jgi:hypothetical protein
MSERERPRRSPIEVELWTPAPTRRFETVGPVAARVRAASELSAELERRLDRRLARAAHAAGADAVLEVVRAGPLGEGTKRGFEARGLGVRWTEPPPPAWRPGTAGAAVSAAMSYERTGDLRASVRDVVREAPPLETLIRESSLGRAATERLATIATGSPLRRRAAQAIAGAVEARARSLNVSPQARARLERWAHEAKQEIASRPQQTVQRTSLQIPSGCMIILVFVFAIIAFNFIGTCIRVFSEFSR